VGLDDRATREKLTAQSMEQLLLAHGMTGGDIISAGGTGTFDINVWANEIQAGSYVLMDTAYAKLNLPFRQGLTVLATVISATSLHAVGDCGLKALGMDHGNPSIEGDHQVWFVSDEHITFGPASAVKPGDKIRVMPAHIDPTFAYHEKVHLVRGEQVLETWPIDLRGW
jgi:D-serine deaminase-like pyridoxal phosphate-dependent protein